MKVLIIFGLFLFASAVNCQVNYDVDVKQYPGSLCKRDCNNAETRICYFHWTMEHYHTLGPACKNCGTGSVEDCYSEQCIPGDGTPRGVMSINRKFPSPNIHVCRNDLVVVDIMNAMSGTSASIHWHGFHMRQTPFYDGVPYVTQCPIGYSQTFRYTFWASEAGTQWYHSHSGHHKSNGQYGGIVVRKPDSEENHRFEYDYDLPEHLIIISDWMEYDAEMYVPGLRQSPTGLSPDNLLINGRGMKNINATKSGLPVVKVPLEVFRVQAGKRYRFRLINAMSHVCPTAIEIEHHSLRVIASDSYDLQPVTVEKLISNAGERYDFVVDANQNQGTFWIRVSGVGVCDVALRLQQFAKLTYDQSVSLQVVSSDLTNLPAYNAVLNSQQRTLNHPLTVCGPEDKVNLCVTDLSSYDLGRGIVDVSIPENNTIYLGFKQNAINEKNFFTPNNYKHFMTVNRDRSTVATINGISTTFPSISLATQLDEVSSVNFCKEGETPLRCRIQGYCDCVHRIKVPLNSIIEFVIVDEIEDAGLVPHPFHLHGFPLYVMDILQNFGQDQMTVASAQQIILDSPTPRSFGRRYPIKDVISIPSKGYVRFRIRADNPGFWLLHCHYEWHLATGMGLILQVGETHEMVKPPSDFPKCGNFAPNQLNGIFTPQWISLPANKEVPSFCTSAGSENYPGFAFYIARKVWSSSEIVIGKYNSRTKVQTFGIPTYNSEYSYSDNNVEIFCGGSTRWIRRTSSDFDENKMVQGGRMNNGNLTYVCQASYQGFLMPGSYDPTINCCTVTYNGQKSCQSTFSILQLT